MSAPLPELLISEVGGRVRLGFSGLGYVEGDTLQEAGDELVRRLVDVASAFRSSGLDPSSEWWPDRALVEYMWELGEVAARHGDLRGYVFGATPEAA